MAVQFNEDKKIFRLDTETSTYLMGLTPEGYLGHIYYGCLLYTSRIFQMLKIKKNTTDYTENTNWCMTILAEDRMML